MSRLKKMMRELHMSRRSARNLLHEFRRLYSLNKRKLRDAVRRRKKRIADEEKEILNRKLDYSYGFSIF